MKTTNTHISTSRTVCASAGTLLLADDPANTLGVPDVFDENRSGLNPAIVPRSTGTALSSLALALTSGTTCLDDVDLLNFLTAIGLVTPTLSTATGDRRVHQLTEFAGTVD